MARWVGAWVDGFVDGWMGGWMGGWVDGYIYIYTYVYVCNIVICNPEGPSTQMRRHSVPHIKPIVMASEPTAITFRYLDPLAKAFFWPTSLLREFLDGLSLDPLATRWIPLNTIQTWFATGS